MFEGRTSLLQWALLNRSATGLKALLEAGADPVHADEKRRYGDALCVQSRRFNLPGYSVGTSGGSGHAKRDHRSDPAHGRPAWDRDAQFAKLIAAGADLNRVDDMGNTALHVAAKINSLHVLDLLRAGADPLVRNRKNQTFQAYLALTSAQVLSAQGRGGRTQIAGWLRKHGIEPTFPL